MSRTLVIKGADFSQNYVEQVTYADKPCTGITLNKASTTIENNLDTETLVATVTPLDTSDAIIWVSSDTDIATVQNGVITAVGIGTAVITAQCGEYSATCSVTCNGNFNFLASKGAFLYTASSRDYYSFNDTAATDSFTVGSSDGTLYASNNESADGWIYPVIVPKNAVRLCVRCMTQYWGLSRLGYLNTEEASTSQPTCAKKVADVNGANNLGWGDKTYNGQACYGNDVTLNTTDDYDSIIMLFKQQGSGAVTDSDIAGTHIWFETESA